MPTDRAPVSLGALCRFWLPLLATWLMMALEGPFLAAVIARLAEPKPNLAAYGVAFAFAIIVEAPVIMMLSAATALVTDRARHRALFRFTVSLNALITAAMVLLVLTPAFDWIVHDLIGLDPGVAHLTRVALIILLPWPGAIGFRRYDQGVLIRGGRTRRVALGTVVRLATMGATATALALLTDLPGAWVGAAGLTAGVCAEATVIHLIAAPARRALAPAPAGAEPLTLRAIVDFYLPLALTSTIALAVQPVVTFFMGQARFPLESLAVLPVLNSLVFIFRTPGLSFQEVAIARLDDDAANLPPVRRFALILAAGASGGLALLAFTPLSRVWLETVSGLQPDLAAYAFVPLRLMVVLPGLSVLLSLQRALLVWGRRTRAITWASVLEVGTIAVILTTTVVGLDLVGVTAAALAYLGGRVLANLYLVAPMRAVSASAR